MVRAGYPEAAIRGVLGENFLRVAREVWQVRVVRGQPRRPAGVHEAAVEF